MWGEELGRLRIEPDDMILIQGAKLTRKYGDPQLNVNPKDGKVIVDPSHQCYKLPGHFVNTKGPVQQKLSAITKPSPVRDLNTG